jgi:Ribonuclease G/E
VKGRQVLIEPLPAGGHAAALLVDGRLQDLLIDPDPADPAPRPEAIHRAVPARPMKGLGGVMVDLGAGTGFLRTARPPAPGRPLLVQVTAWAEPGKAPPVTDRLILKGRAAILTPGAPGLNLARGLRDPEARAALSALAAQVMAGAPADLGLILRSAAAATAPDEIAAEIAGLRADWSALAGTAGPPACLRPAPGAAAEARRDWTEPAAELREGPAVLGDAGVWEDVAALRRPLVALGQGTLVIEATRALVAVDVNTGGDLSPAAALKANLAAARELPRQLRLRGLGGQITIDFAPLAKADRPRIEHALAAALRADGIDTAVAGWTPLGHLELNRKRARRPLRPADFPGLTSP